jgi:hypothetical protein
VDEENNNAENQQVNQEIEKKRKELKNRFGNTYDKFEDYYFGTCKPNFVWKSDKKVYEIFDVIKKFENFSFYYTYDYSGIYGDINNLGKIYSLYYKNISKDKDAFIKDLLYFYRFGYINIFMPSEEDKFFIKSHDHVGVHRMPYKALEHLCEIYKHLKNGQAEIRATIYFTSDGESVKKENLGEYLIDKATEQQKNALEQQLILKDEIEELKKRMEGYSKEIISIISIILTVAPLIAINIAELKKLDKSEILLINGSLIIGISTIFSILIIGFFKLRRRHFLLLIPLLVGIGMIWLSFHITN